MKTVFQVHVELRDRDTPYWRRAGIFIVARDIIQAVERAEKHFHSVYKRMGNPLRALRTVSVERLGEAVS